MANGNTNIAEQAETIEKALKVPFNDYANMEGILVASKLLQGTMTSAAKLVAPFTQVQNAAIELAKSVGLSSKSIMSIAEGVVTQNRDLALSMKYNMSSEDMVKMQTGLLSKLGRNVAIDRGVERNEKGEVVGYREDSEFENLIAAGKVFGEDFVGDIASAFDKVGKSMGSAAKATGKLFQEAGEYGINLKLYSKNFVDNIGMAQMYNFRNGINGLKEMARKATEIRQNMKDVASFADKVGSVTGAVETAANLQVLGGSFTALANPLAMLNESLTNMEGLQDRFTQMTEGAAHYNSVTKQIEMDPVTRMRMKRAAEAMGVDASSMIDQAYAQARRGEITSQMEGYGGFSAEMQKLLPNVGEIDEYGRAGATIDGQFRTLGEIAGNEKLQQQLVEETRSESDDIKEIAKSVLGIEGMLSGRVEQVKNEAAYRVTQFENYGGKTTYDALLDTFDNTFTAAAIRGATKLDEAYSQLIEPLALATYNLIGGAAAVANSNTKDEAIESGKAMINNAVRAVSDDAADTRAVEWVSNKTGAIMGGLQTAFEGLSNGITDISGGWLTPGNPWTSDRAVSTNTSSSPWSNPSNETPMAPSATQYQPYSWGWDYNKKTVPTTTVSKPEYQSSSQGSTRTLTRAVQEGEYNIKMNGTITMNLNGDKADINLQDFIKMFKDSGNDLNEFAKLVADAISKMDSRR